MTFQSDFEVEHYLDHQGESFVGRFDALSYLYLTRLMDYFDPFSDTGLDLAAVTSRVVAISFDSDWRFGSEHSQRIVRILSEGGVRARHAEVVSAWGHDSFLLYLEDYHRIVAQALVEDQSLGRAERLYRLQAPARAREAPDALGRDRVELARERYERLRGRECIARRLVRAMGGEAQLAREVREGDVARRAPVALVEPNQPENGRVHHRPPQSQAFASQRGREERALHSGRVDDRDGARHRVQQRVDRLIQRRRVREVGGAKPVHADRGFADLARRPHEPFDRRAELDAGPLDRDRPEREDLVAPGVKAAQLQVDGAEAGPQPRRGARGKARGPVGGGARCAIAGASAHRARRSSSEAIRFWTEATALKASFRWLRVSALSSPGSR